MNRFTPVNNPPLGDCLPIVLLSKHAAQPQPTYTEQHQQEPQVGRAATAAVTYLERLIEPRGVTIEILQRQRVEGRGLLRSEARQVAAVVRVESNYQPVVTTCRIA